MAKSNEPLWWSLFSAGGVVAALLVPITLVLTGLAVPAEFITEDALRRLIGHPATRVYLFVLISLPLFHWAHRFRHVAVDLGLKGLGLVLPVICYGTAIAGTAAALFVLVRI